MLGFGFFGGSDPEPEPIFDAKSDSEPEPFFVAESDPEPEPIFVAESDGADLTSDPCIRR